MTLLGVAPAQTMGSYAPSLVVSFGFDRLKSNAMTSIGAWLLVVTNLAWGYIADKTGRRGLMVFLGVLILWGLTVCLKVILSCRIITLADPMSYSGSLETACSLSLQTGT
jgi:MFS family permease